MRASLLKKYSLIMNRYFLFVLSIAFCLCGAASVQAQKFSVLEKGPITVRRNSTTLMSIHVKKLDALPGIYDEFGQEVPFSVGDEIQSGDGQIFHASVVEEHGLLGI